MIQVTRLMVAVLALVSLSFSMTVNGQEMGVDPFTGTATATIDLTAGVTLSYGSAYLPLIMSSENRTIQSSWVGSGWYYQPPSIQVDLKGTTNIDDDDYYYVGAAGERSQIVKDTLGKLRLANNPTWKVELSTVEPTAGNIFVTGVTLRMSDGTKLLFGDFQVGIGSRQANRCVFYWGGRVTDYLVNKAGVGRIVHQWDLAQVYSPNGVLLRDYYYAQEQESVTFGAGSNSYTRASYLNHIIDRRTGQRITFLRGNRTAAEYQNVALSAYKIRFYQTQFLDSVQLYPSETATQAIQTWDLTYTLTGSGAKTKRMLQSVIRKDARSRALPSTTMTYDGQNLLSSIQSPEGGTRTFSSSSNKYHYLTQTADPSILGEAGSNATIASTTGRTIARFQNGLSTLLQILNYDGEWGYAAISTGNSGSTGSDFLKAVDNHVLLVYQSATGKDTLLVYDWRDDTRTWELGFSIGAASVNGSYTKLRANISPSGGHVLLIAGSSSAYTAKIYTWDSQLKSWRSGQSENQWTHNVSHYPNKVFEVRDDMAFYDYKLSSSSGGSDLLQWRYFMEDYGTGSEFRYYDWQETNVNTTSTPDDEVYSLHGGYIGRWDKHYNNDAGMLYAYNFVLNSSSDQFQSISTQSWTGHTGSKKGVDFSDERMLVYTLNGATQLDLHTYKRNAEDFVALSVINRAIAGWSTSWDMKAKINYDWIFLLNHRIGAVTDYDASLHGFSWDYTSGAYVFRDTALYAYVTSNPCGIPLNTADLTLTDEFVVVNARSSTTSGGCSTEVFTDAFKLDRVNPADWDTAANIHRLFVGTTSVEYKVLGGVNFVTRYAVADGSMDAKIFHGVDKDWSDSIRVTKVNQTSSSDAMGSTIVTNYTYDASPTFDGALFVPGFGNMKRSMSGAGSTKTFMKKSISQPRLRGSVDSVVSYKQGDTTVVHRWLPIWSITQDPNKWYLFQFRKTAESTWLDSLTTSVSYTYNVHGQVAQTTEDVNLPSEHSGLRDRVTTVTYACEQDTAMLNANMLTQVYQVEVNASESGLTPVLLSKTQTEYSAGYPARTRVWNGTGWDTTSTVVSRDAFGNVQELRNIDYVTTTTKYGFNKSLPIATFVNAANSATVAAVFDDRDSTAWVSTYQSWLLTDGAYQQIDGTGQGGWDNPTKNLSASLDDGVLEADIRFDAAGNYRYAAIAKNINGSNFVRFEIRKTENTVMIAARKNGIMIYQSVAFTANEKQWYHLRGEIEGQTARLYVDGVLYHTMTDTLVDLGAGYIGLCTFGTVATFDNPRFYPLGSIATMQSYDQLTLAPINQVDANGTGSSLTYDGFGRPTQSYNADKKYLTEQSYYFSRDGHGGSFSSTDPNLGTTVTYTAESGYHNFRTSTGWTSAGQTSFNILYQGEITARVGKIPGDSSGCGGEEETFQGGGGGGESSSGWSMSLGTPTYPTSGIETSSTDSSYSSTPYVPVTAAEFHASIDAPDGIALDPEDGESLESMFLESGIPGGCYPDDWGYIKKYAGNGEAVARVDFFTGTTSGSQRPLGFDSSGHSFIVEYVPGSSQFKVIKRFSGGAESYAYTFGLSVSTNKWYTIEITKGKEGTTGKCYAWVFPKGESRNYADFVGVTGYPTAWAANVYTWSKVNYIYVANHYVGTFSQLTTYTDGSGRTRQSHTRNDSTDLISVVDFDTLGRQYREWLPFRYHVSHAYDPSYASHSSSIYGTSNACKELLFKDDPLARVSTQKELSGDGQNEHILLEYGSEVVEGTRYWYTQQKHKKSNAGSAPWIRTREYRDLGGRSIRSTTYAEGVAGDTITPKTDFTFGGLARLSTAPKGDVTTQRYSFLGRVAYRITPDEGTSKYIYDRAGRLRFMIDSVGIVANPDRILYWKYDTFGRVSEKGYFTGTWDSTSLQSSANSSPSYPTTPVTWRKKYAYDRVNGNSANLVSRLYSVMTNNDEDSTAEVEEYLLYDRAGNPTSVRQKVIDYSASGVDTTIYLYDHLGRISKITYPASSFGSVSVAYTYDQAGRVATVETPGGIKFAEYVYSNKGLINTELLNSSYTGRTRTYTFDTKHRLTGISSTLFTEKLLYTTGGYNSNEGFYHGLIASDSAIYYSGGPSTAIGKFAYDNFGRLTVADNTISANDIGVGTPTEYDKNGNITKMKRSTSAAETYYYYSGTNQLQTVGGSGGTYTYDQTGNVVASTFMGIQYLRYDPFTMLTMCEKRTAGDSLNIQYGAAKERVLKIHTNGANVTKTRYIHGLNEYPLADKISSGSERRYVYGPNGLIAMKLDWKWYFVMRDHLNSVRLLFDTAGAAVTTMDFDPYGKLGRSTINTDIRYKFTGQENDNEIASLFYNFRARMYSGNHGIFYTLDPARSTFSPYGYAKQNPIIYSDPSGSVDFYTHWLYSSSYSPLHNPSPSPRVATFIGNVTINAIHNGELIVRRLGELWDQSVRLLTPPVDNSINYVSHSVIDGVMFIKLSITLRIDGTRSVDRTDSYPDLYDWEWRGTDTWYWDERINIPPQVNLDENIEWGEDHHIDLDDGVEALASLGAFFMRSAPKSRFDPFIKSGAFDYGRHVDFGNFNYGVVGTAMGIPMQVLERMGGAAQEYLQGNYDPKNGHWYGSQPYGDNPGDRYWYLVGRAYYYGTTGR